MAPGQRVEQLVVPALEHIGIGWEQGRVALSQVYMSSRICEELVDAVLPRSRLVRQDQPKMAIAVLEDYHLLGKRIIYAALRASGFDLLDYGRMDLASLMRRVSADEVRILLVSSLMLRSALRVQTLTAELKRLGLPVQVVVGGAPFRFDPELVHQVGADVTARNSSEAIAVVTRMVAARGVG